MTKTKLALTCALMFTCAHSMADDKKHNAGGPGAPGHAADPNISNYKCSITTYAEAKSGKEEHLRGPDYVKMNGPTDAVPAPGFETTGKDGKKSKWSVTRVPGSPGNPARVLVEFTGPNGENHISSTLDGAPMFMQIPGSKYILTCKPPKDAFQKMCGTGDKGDDIKPDAGKFGIFDEMRSIRPDAGAYGEMMFLRPDAGVYGSTLQAIPSADIERSFRALRKKNPGLETYIQLSRWGVLDVLRKAAPELHDKLTDSLLKP